MTDMGNRFRTVMIPISRTIPSWVRHPMVLSAVGVALLLTVVLFFHSHRVERIDTLDELYRYADQGWIRGVWVGPTRIDGTFSDAAILERGLGAPTRFHLHQADPLAANEFVRRLESATVEIRGRDASLWPVFFWQALSLAMIVIPMALAAKLLWQVRIALRRRHDVESI